MVIGNVIVIPIYLNLAGQAIISFSRTSSKTGREKNSTTHTNSSPLNRSNSRLPTPMNRQRDSASSTHTRKSAFLFQSYPITSQPILLISSPLSLSLSLLPPLPLPLPNPLNHNHNHNHHHHHEPQKSTERKKKKK